METESSAVGRIPGVEGDTVPTMNMANEGEVVRRTGKNAIADFFRSKTLYDVQRQSGKVRVRACFPSVFMRIYRYHEKRLYFLVSLCEGEIGLILTFCLVQVVVFDTNIPIQLAFYALLEHGKSGGSHVIYHRQYLIFFLKLVV